jgi:hypothetical protein
MEEEMITRRNDVGPGLRFTKNVTCHFYPFDNMPLLESHIHPKFVIYDCGSKLAEQGDGLFEAKIVKDFPSLSMVQALYAAWVLKSLPPFAKTDPSYGYDAPPATFEYENHDGDDDDPNDGDYENRSDRTKPNRREETRIRPYTRNAAKQDGNAGGGSEDGSTGTSLWRGGAWPRPVRSPEYSPAELKKRKVLSGSPSHRPLILSEVTLSRLNQQLGDVTSGGDRVKDWSKRRKLAHW